jgi:hypothetical protein
MKVVGFLILLAIIFIAAHSIGAHLGPVTTSHSQVQYSGGTGGSGGGGMNMSGMNDASP